MNEDHDPNEPPPAEGVVRNEHGDMVQDIGTRMIEKDSYERVVEGLKISADACAHLMRSEPESAAFWRGLRDKLDKIRRGAISYAGIDDPISARETQDLRGDAMPWRQARGRLYEGIKQAAGGARQLASCHRGDTSFLTIAEGMEEMERNLRARTQSRSKSAHRRGLVWMPGDA